MRATTIAAILYLTLATTTPAQTLTINSVNLYLGEAEVQARADITAAGMTISKLGPDSFALTVKRGDTYDSVGDVAFAKGKVTWVQRDWYLDQTPNDKEKLASIFYSAASSLLEGADHAGCTVSVRTLDSAPSWGVSKITKIECLKPGHIHALILLAVDCSTGCSTGGASGSLGESIKQIQE